MAKVSDFIAIVFEPYIKDSLTVDQRGQLLADILCAAQYDYFNTDDFDGNCFNEDVRLSIELIKKRDNDT